MLGCRFRTCSCQHARLRWRPNSARVSILVVSYMLNHTRAPPSMNVFTHALSPTVLATAECPGPAPSHSRWIGQRASAAPPRPQLRTSGRRLLCGRPSYMKSR